MKSSLTDIQKLKRLFGWMGTVFLVLIIPIKALRWIHGFQTVNTMIDITPSILGPPGLLFLLLSSSGRLARLTLAQTALLTGVIALGLEFAQLLPRPGFLYKLYYTFDLFDVLASTLSSCAGYLVARVIIRTRTDTYNF